MTTDTVKITRTKAYLVQVSKGEPIQIDEDELPKVLAAMESGRPAILRQGVINPSYITSVIPDKDRIHAWLRDCDYYGDSGARARAQGIKPLSDLIDAPRIQKLLAGGNVLRLNKAK